MKLIKWENINKECRRGVFGLFMYDVSNGFELSFIFFESYMENIIVNDVWWI